MVIHGYMATWFFFAWLMATWFLHEFIILTNINMSLFFELFKNIIFVKKTHVKKYAIFARAI